MVYLSTLTRYEMAPLVANRFTLTQRLSGELWFDQARSPANADLQLMFRYAIKGAPNQKLLLEDIYYAIESRVSVSAVHVYCATNGGVSSHILGLLLRAGR